MSADSEKPNIIRGNWTKYCTVAKSVGRGRPIWTSVVVRACFACALQPVRSIPVAIFLNHDAQSAAQTTRCLTSFRATLTIKLKPQTKTNSRLHFTMTTAYLLSVRTIQHHFCRRELTGSQLVFQTLQANDAMETCPHQNFWRMRRQQKRQKIKSLCQSSNVGEKKTLKNAIQLRNGSVLKMFFGAIAKVRRSPAKRTKLVSLETPPSPWSEQKFALQASALRPMCIQNTIWSPEVRFFRKPPLSQTNFVRFTGLLQTFAMVLYTELASYHLHQVIRIGCAQSCIWGMLPQ